MTRFLLLAVSHVVAVALGFALGVYTLPILVAPDAPTLEEVESAAGEASTQRWVISRSRGSAAALRHSAWVAFLPGMSSHSS